MSTGAKFVVLSLVAMLALASLLFCLSGVAMAASFSVSYAETSDHWRRVANYYKVGSVGSMLVLAGSAISMFRVARRRSSRRAA